MSKLSNLPPGVTDRMIEEAAGVETEETTRNCSICKEPFKGFGHNPEPILPFKERCCQACNVFLVVPARIFGMEHPGVLRALQHFGVQKRNVSRKRG